jgi:dTDP-4-amino-4,6-dideoxygalactose transaminase
VTDLPDIPFNRARLEGRELEHVRTSMESGHTSSGGPFAKQVARLLVEELGTAEALMTTSCTTALEMSALLLDIEPGDTVIVPSYTFTSSALAFAREGARILFCDVEPETLGPDPRHVAELLDDSVRAVVAVHYAGIACRIDELREVLRERPDVAIIEDTAHALLGRWRGRPLGTFGRFGTLSFHETKNFVCGEGGALVVNEDHDVDRARVLYDKGTNRQAFLLGQVDKYTWKDTGSSFGLSDVLAAYLVAQLEHRDAIQAKRRTVHERYTAALTPYAEELDFRVMEVPEGRDPAYHLFYVLLSTRERRNDVLEAMTKKGVRAAFHYQALHSSDAGRRFAERPTDCPVTDDVSGRLLRVPFYNNLSERDLGRTVEAFLDAVRASLED